jgi:acyl carrier protein
MTDTTPTPPTTEAIDARSREALVSFGVDADAIAPDADLKGLDVDSLDVVELCHILRADLGIDVEARDLLEVRTYGDLIATVVQRPTI